MTGTDAHPGPPPVRRYATHDGDRRPSYRLGNEPLPFSEDVRLAALDVMILTFAAKRHAEWLMQLGACPSDVAGQIRRHLAVVQAAITPLETGSPQTVIGESPSPQIASPSRQETGSMRCNTRLFT